mmetsp:Transcript_30629/g.50586  ORF Transcript_30629/g.50586 Transcript_30629/m.50586 type:complete len:256 (+) Transcript_30629:124-891(+)|eukprot:CAMPEP_0119015604 /NCGR_PEP_ID=MMETSP1176-20130426/11299_1 /TAXON_ID=265551 /ORGANISM="Synedropsis recta cf, Strain CCMP1620" /LENGTH=255 /DNA_ID=CAMNT_0006968911 /DNA_START=119 /DNA_END=886 /DNA_ORIENTATION=-
MSSPLRRAFGGVVAVWWKHNAIVDHQQDTGASTVGEQWSNQCIFKIRRLGVLCHLPGADTAAVDYVTASSSPESAGHDIVLLFFLFVELFLLALFVTFLFKKKLIVGSTFPFDMTKLEKMMLGLRAVRVESNAAEVDIKEAHPTPGSSPQEGPFATFGEQEGEGTASSSTGSNSGYDEKKTPSPGAWKGSFVAVGAGKKKKGRLTSSLEYKDSWTDLDTITSSATNWENLLRIGDSDSSSDEKEQFFGEDDSTEY